MLIVLGVIVVVLILSVIAAWIGLHIKPGAFPAYTAPGAPLQAVPLPDHLPAPVARYYQAALGSTIPVIETAVLSGSAELRLGLTFPSRYRFVHEAGRNYRHYLETTAFTRPLMRVNEFYLDGKSRMELPFGISEDEPKINQAANLGLWGEAISFPSIYLTDPRVRWEAIDDTHARLIVPFGDTEDSFTVTFDPTSGLPTTLEAKRYKDIKSEKIRWTIRITGWGVYNGMKLPSVTSLTWEGDSAPWAVFHLDEIVLNADVHGYIRQHGV